jgi:hypothetical protein
LLTRTVNDFKIKKKGREDIDSNAMDLLGMLLECFGSLLVSFGNLRVSLGRLLECLGSLLVSFGRLRVSFPSLLSILGNLLLIIESENVNWRYGCIFRINWSTYSYSCQCKNLHRAVIILQEDVDMPFVPNKIPQLSA